MKKTYRTPAIDVQEITIAEHLLVVSGGDTGIGYGGEDPDGTFDPASRLFGGELWDANELKVPGVIM